MATRPINALMRKRENWNFHKKEAFRTAIDDKLESFELTSRNKEYWRISPGVGIWTDWNGERADSIKHILISLRIFRAGILGTCRKLRIMRVQSPYCENVQKLRVLFQKCGNCKKSFYLFADH